MKKLDLKQIREHKWKDIIFYSKFVEKEGLINTDQVGVWYKWKDLIYWIIFEKNKEKVYKVNKGVGKIVYDFWIEDKEIFIQMRKAARKHFFSLTLAGKEVWKKEYAQGARKGPFPKPKNPAGLTEKKPELDLFATQETLEDVQKALSHRRHKGRRKDNKLHGIKPFRVRLPKHSDDYDKLEEEGQKDFFEDKPLDF